MENKFLIIDRGVVNQRPYRGLYELITLIWKNNGKSDIVAIFDRSITLFLFGVFWRLTGRYICFCSNNTNPIFFDFFAVWVADRVFYSDINSFLSKFYLAEKISSLSDVVEIKTKIILSKEVSFSKLKLISPAFFRYILSGSLVVSVNLITLFFFTNILGFWYLISSIVSFFVAFFVSFFVQKIWTYRDNVWIVWNWQLAFYFLVSLINLFLNTVILYFLVEFFSLPYLISQAMAVGLISLALFFVYGRVIFRPKLDE